MEQSFVLGEKMMLGDTHAFRVPRICMIAHWAVFPLSFFADKRFIVQFFQSQ